MNDIIFKRLEIEDIDKMQEILENDDIEYNAENITKFIENKNNYGFIGIKDNKVVTFLYGYGMLRPDGRKMFYIHSVDVLPNYQNNGIGTKLMEFVINYIKNEKDFYKFFVLADSDNIRACNVYKKYGNQDEPIMYSNKI